MAPPKRTSNLMKPWAWLAAVAAVCLALASSTALYAINSGVRLGLPWWTAVAAPALVYALVLPLCIPRIRLGGWLTGFLTLAVLHVALGLATAWLYAHVGFTSFEEALAPAFWGFPPALVLEMVGSLLMTLPFMGALAPRPATPRVQPEAPFPKGATPGRAQQDLSSQSGKSRGTWARASEPSEPPAAPVAVAVLEAVPPPGTAVAPVLEEPTIAAPERHALHAAPLAGVNGSALETADPSAAETPDFRQALSELFGAPVAERKADTGEALEPLAELVADEVSPRLTAEAPAWAAPNDIAPVTPQPVEPVSAGAVVRIPFDRVVGQLPPGAFRVPLEQVGARLREAGTLLVAQVLILPQLGEGVVQVAWEAVVEQFPAAVFAVAPAEVKDRIVNGRLLLPLDEIVRQLPPDVFGASMARGPVAVPGIESFPALFKPLGWEEPSQAPDPVVSLREAAREAVPLSIEVPSANEVAQDLKWTPPSPDARPQAPADVIAPLRVEPEHAFPAEIDEPPRKLVEIDPVSEVIDLDGLLQTGTAPVVATAAPQVEPAAGGEAANIEPTPMGAVVRIPFDRVVGQLPPGAFRVPLGQVGAQLREPETLLVAQALILPQLGEGVVQVAWEAVVEQFPAAMFAVAPASVQERIEDGRLQLPLDEIVRQLPPDVFGASMASGPVAVPGIESFPVPFKPLGSEEPSPIPAQVVPVTEPVSAPAPVKPANELTAAETAAPETTVPETTVPQPVPVAPIYEAQAFEEPVPADPPVMQPERRDHAESLAALMAPLETVAIDDVRVGDFAIISVSTAGVAAGTVAAAAGRLSPIIARGAPQPIEQATLRGAGGMLVLTPVGSGWSTGTTLAVGMRSSGALARLEMLARRAAAGHEPEGRPAPAHSAAPPARLDVTQTPPAIAAAAEDLAAFGPLAAQSYREPKSGALVHCFVSPGVPAAELAPFAWELAQAMAQSAPAEALGSFHSAVLRSGSTRVEIRRLPSAGGPALILVVGGADTGRPGLAHLQVQRTAVRLSEA